MHEEIWRAAHVDKADHVLRDCLHVKDGIVANGERGHHNSVVTPWDHTAFAESLVVIEDEPHLQYGGHRARKQV